MRAACVLAEMQSYLWPKVPKMQATSGPRYQRCNLPLAQATRDAELPLTPTAGVKGLRCTPSAPFGCAFQVTYNYIVVSDITYSYRYNCKVQAQTVHTGLTSSWP
jgi:hypothetical protein